MPVLPARPFHHAALLYESDRAFLADTLEFIRQGLAADEPVVVALSEAKAARLGRALGADAGRVVFAHPSVNANPARIIPALDAFVEQRGGRGRPMRAVGEPIWSERSEEEVVECQHHEALLNRAFADADGLRLLCTYDAAELPVPVLREALCSHPFVTLGDRGVRSGKYRGPDGLPPSLDAPLPPPPVTARTIGFGLSTLADVRREVTACARRAGLDEPGRQDLVLAVHELATNSVLHAAGIGVLRTWTEGRSAVCEVRDAGHITDPLAGRRTPAPEQLGGRGLWIAHQLADLIQLRTGPGGTTIRIRRHGRG